MNESIELLHEIVIKTKEQIQKVIVGQEETIDLCLMAILSGQHAILEGVPGVAKTLLVRCLAKTMSCDFGRIQFSPDLMPSDITGTSVFDLKSNEFRFVKGPVFCSFLLADEINRAPAKTQSALLQAMQEKVVTVDGKTYELSPNFTVFATQNPVEFEGTYPLPEAQKDRFMLKINVNYPEKEEELSFAKKVINGESPERKFSEDVIQPVIDPNHLSILRNNIDQITIKDDIIDYIVSLIRKTRSFESILFGAGPRATFSMLFASRVKALFEGRDFVVPDDVQNMLRSVLGHRIVLRPEYEMEGVSAEEVLQSLLKEVSVPK